MYLVTINRPPAVTQCPGLFARTSFPLEKGSHLAPPAPSRWRRFFFYA
jgi:hypothetical protein